MCRNVFVRSAVLLGEQISGEDGENKARVRGALTEPEEKTEFRAIMCIECIEHMHTNMDEKSKKPRDIATDRVNLYELSSLCAVFFLRITYYHMKDILNILKREYYASALELFYRD